MTATISDEAATARRVGVAAAEAGLFALALATTAGFLRVFVGWDWLLRVGACVVAAHLLAAVLRRRGVGLAWSLAASAIAAPVVIGAVLLPDTTLLGLPTPDTATTATEEIRFAFGQFERLVAPVEAAPGFLIVISLVMWLFGTFGDACLIRLAAPVQAAVPYVSTFLVGGVLAREEGRLQAAGWFVVGVAVYMLGVRAWRASGYRWMRGDALVGVRSLVLSGALVLVGALSLGALVGPSLPGADSEAVVNLRDLGRNAPARTVRSPFVGLREKLGTRSNAIMFRATSPEPTYWRLTSLEIYDPERDAWIPQAGYERASGELPRTTPEGFPTATLEQRVDIVELDSIFLPAAFEPRAVDADFGVSQNPSSSSLIVARGSTIPRRDTYVVQSELPVWDPALFGDGRAGDPGDGYLDLPRPLGPVALALVEEIRASGRTDLERARRLQDVFQTYTYDERADFSEAADPLDAFLIERSGFCQQFASTFALMARELGIPARVAVGFTYGEQDEATGEWVVRGRHAHAWPEVHFAGSGWVPFEPTPSRGNPQAEQLTGLPSSQARPGERAPTGPDPTVTTTTAAVTTTTVPEDRLTPNNPGTTATRTEADSAEATPGWWALILIALGTVIAIPALLVAATAARRWRRRRTHRDDAALRVELAWLETVEWLGALDLTATPGETPGEFAHRAARHLGLPELRRLAELETRRRYAKTGPEDQEAEEAERLREHLVAACSERAGRGARGRRLLGLG